MKVKYEESEIKI